MLAALAFCAVNNVYATNDPSILQHAVDVVDDDDWNHGDYYTFAGFSEEHYAVFEAENEHRAIRGTHEGKAVKLKRFPKYKYAPALSASKAQCQQYRDLHPMRGDDKGFEGNWWMLPHGCIKYTDGDWTRVIWNNYGHDMDCDLVHYCDQTKSERVGWDWEAVRSSHHGRAVELTRFPKGAYAPVLAADKGQCQLYRNIYPMVGDWAGFEGNWWDLPHGCQVYKSGNYARVLWNNGGNNNDHDDSERVGWVWKFERLNEVCASCRAGTHALDANGRCNHWCSSGRYCGTGEVYQEGGWNCDFAALRTCITTANVPVMGIGFQMCGNGNQNHYMQLDFSSPPGIPGGAFTTRGRIRFPCALGTWCAPNGGDISFEREMFRKSKPHPKGVFDITGSIGFMITMTEPANKANGGDVDVSLAPFGMLGVEILGGTVSASGTFSGVFSFANLKFKPFDCGTFTFALGVQIDVIIALVKMTVVLSMDEHGDWTAHFPPLNQVIVDGVRAIGDAYAGGMDHIRHALGIKGLQNVALTPRARGGKFKR